MDHTDAIIRELHAEARQMLKAKEDDEFIILSLMRKGQTRNYAQMILQNVRSDTSNRKKFYRLLLVGTFVFLVGMALRLETWNHAVPGASPVPGAPAVPGIVFFAYNGIMVTGIAIISRAIIIFRK
ncbi:MAG TPA: hypothetical protein VG052_13340 [Puia sp.]|jgi:hypothetical protein|nr:hypothetical protein [Puia sp.]